MDDLLREFIIETNENLGRVDAELVQFEQEPNNARMLDDIFRLVHTIKGTCGFLNLPRLEALTHAAETLMSKFRAGLPVSAAAVTLILSTLDRIKELLDELEKNRAEPSGNDDDLIGELRRFVENASGKRAPPAGPPVTPAPPMSAAANGAREPRSEEIKPEDRLSNQSIRVQLGTLEHLMATVSELVLTRNQLLEIMRRIGDSEFNAPLQRLSSITAELQEGVMRTRMQPIGNAWQKLPRIVRDLAVDLGKDIALELSGGETELDRQVLELIKDPLLHMIRNSADHGIEAPQQRIARGKPAQATICLTAHHEGGHVIIGISDDGRGLNTDRIKSKALALGLAPPAQIEAMSDAQIHDFIFTPGFSTASEVTSISGRGVGMDVVRNNMDRIGGTIEVQSAAGEGTRFRIKIPLTLAIIPALIVEVAGERFAIPQRAIQELVHARADSEHRIERIKETALLRLRGRLLPLVSLHRWLSRNPDEAPAASAPAAPFIVVVQVGTAVFGLIVDAVLHSEEIVVKPMSAKLRHIATFSGTTILGDGAVIMIIDPNAIARELGIVGNAQEYRAKPSDDQSVRSNEPLTSLLLFRAGSAGLKAVPLSLVTRLEEIDAGSIEFAGGRHVVQYCEQLMPLVPVSDEVRICTSGVQPVLVFSHSNGSIGLAVDEIVDVVEDKLQIEIVSERPGVLGSAIVRGETTEIIDVGHFLPLASNDWFRHKDAPRSAAPTILFVDDSPFFRNLLTPVLQAAGYHVTVASGAPQALALIKAGPAFDLLVTDIHMPDMDGFQLAETVRADERTAKLPIIAVSAVSSPEAQERGRLAGFDSHVLKSDRQGLLAALRQP
ncbi:MAG TPA: hybrid sensor histidine kinase/response regulator, partial [Bradyrhizobium sp.]|nr:hybrid sensor histidine kinase/response regulator [Bradyrhizobium sp.]